MSRINHLSFVATVLATGLYAASAMAAVNWDGDAATLDWFDAANWNPDGLPISADDVDLYGTGSSANPVVINNGSQTAAALTLDMSAAGQNVDSYLDIYTALTVGDRFSVGTYTSANVHQYNNSSVTAGSFHVDSRDRTSSYILDGPNASLDVATTFATSRHGYFIQNAGSATIGGDARIEGDYDRTAGGNYRMLGGSLTVNSTASSGGVYTNGLAVGYNSDGVMIHSGGTVTVNSGNLEMGSRDNAGITSAGYYIVQDDAALDVHGSVVLGYNGNNNQNKGHFVVSGSGNSSASINVDGWTQNGAFDSITHGYLDLEPDASGLIVIQVAGNVTFGDGALLDIDPLYVPSPGDSWAVMTWTGTLTNVGLALSSTTDPNWTFDLGVTTPDTLTITYIPEPATLALLNIGIVAVASRRRSRVV